MRGRVARLRLRLANGGEGFSAYARLLEEAATLASAEAGYPARWYGRENTVWVIRRSTIDCVAPLARDADLEVVTWVADFRRVRSRREYEVYVSPSTVAALMAHTDWVYVERADGRPRRIPDSMIEAFAPGGLLPALPRAPLVLPAVAAEATAVERSATPEDVDALGHVNNARYFDYVEEASQSVAGAGLHPIRHDLEYLAETRAGDRLLCRCWVIASETSRVEIATEIRRAVDGTPLTRARSVWTA
jgi:acyl-CoA thioester hydrolase